MIDAALGLFGPLAKPECLRASKRGWLIWLRLLPALGAGLVVFVVAWVWATFRDLDPAHLPYDEIRYGLLVLTGALVGLAFLIPPAVLAGSLAGEKERGSIALLLSTQASAGEIVLSRWVGRLAPVSLVAASALPALLWLATLAGLSVPVTAMLVLLPLAVGVGSGGFALGVSAVSKRGRDALLLIYLVDVVLLVVSMLASGPSLMAGWLASVGLGVLDPFGALGPLVWGEEVGPAIASAVAWTILGLGGLGVASWRLRPSCLNDGSGSKRQAGRFRRRWSHRVPPVGTRPMLWKELHIERAGSLGRVGRWVGGLLVLWLGLGSLILGWMVIRDTNHPGSVVINGVSTVAGPAAITTLADWYGKSAILISFLIQWAVGLRAGVTVASERERGTWDGLLTSPLTGGEIVRGKLWGSLHALRWLIIAALIAWTVTWACDGMGTRAYVATLAETLCWSALMAAAGVAMSLRVATATKAMGATLACWLGAYLALRAVALFVCLVVAAACVIGWLTAIQAGLVGVGTTPWFPMTFGPGNELVFCVATVILTVIIVIDTRIRFDRIAGRMTGGATAVKLDELIHGRPMAPVWLGPPPRKSAGLVDLEIDGLARTTQRLSGNASSS